MRAGAPEPGLVRKPRRAQTRAGSACGSLLVVLCLTAAGLQHSAAAPGPYGVVPDGPSSADARGGAGGGQGQSVDRAVQAGAPNPRFGLAHVDVMDLHVARLPGGGTRPNETLPSADLADRFAKAAASGAAWNRWSLYWDMVEQPGGALDWSVVDGIVSRDLAAGLRTLAILQGTPGQYATGGSAAARVPAVGGLPWWPEVMEPGAPESGPARRGRSPVLASPPRGLDAPIFRRADGSGTDDPAQAASVNPDNPWARFVDQALARYRPGGELALARGWPAGVGVRAWEIGNEPNLSHFWSGTAAQFARYLEVAYLVIKRQDPEAVALHGGIADDSQAGAWYGRFADALKVKAAGSPLPARYNYYFDKAGWHWYTYPSQLYNRPPEVQAYLTSRGLPAKPIWVTEMGVPIWNEHPGPCWDPTSPWRATTAEQSGYLWQSFAEGLSRSVELMIHFQTYDDCGNGPTSYDAFGLIRNHLSNQCWTPPEGQACWRLDPAKAGQPRPAYHAFQAATGLFRDVELLWHPAREADFWQRVLFFQPPDRRVMVLWNLLRADKTVSVYATGPEATVHRLDAAGMPVAEPMAPSGGQITVTLPGATNRNNPGNQSAVMAGRPVIIVERDTAAPFRAQVEALPPESPPAFDLSVAAADGGTGVAAFQVFFATAPPPSAADWAPLGEPRSWPASPLSGTATWSFRGDPGRSYFFAARAQDRAGSWSALPAAAQAQTRISGLPLPTDTPAPATPEPATTTPTPRTATPTSTPAPGTPGSPTPATPGSPTPAPATPEPSPTPGQATPSWETPSPAPSATETSSPTASPTYGPLVATLFLPWTARAAERPGTMPEWRVVVPVRGPRADTIPPASGAFWELQAFGQSHGAGTRHQAALGEAIVIAPADRLVARAEVPGYRGDPPQDLGLAPDLFLAGLPQSLANGTFEAGLEDWRLMGSAFPRITADAPSGARAAVLGQDFVGQPELGGGGNSTLFQELDLPEDAPTLSFLYRFDSRASCGSGGCERRDRIEVIVVELEDPNLPAHYLTGPEGLRDPVEHWSHRWFDLSPWSGQHVRVMLNLYQPDAQDPSRAWFDNVAVGPGQGRSDQN